MKVKNADGSMPKAFYSQETEYSIPASIIAFKETSFWFGFAPKLHLFERSLTTTKDLFALTTSDFKATCLLPAM